MMGASAGSSTVFILFETVGRSLSARANTPPSKRIRDGWDGAGIFVRGFLVEECKGEDIKSKLTSMSSSNVNVGAYKC